MCELDEIENYRRHVYRHSCNVTLHLSSYLPALVYVRVSRCFDPILHTIASQMSKFVPKGALGVRQQKSR